MKLFLTFTIAFLFLFGIRSSKHSADEQKEVNPVFNKSGCEKNQIKKSEKDPYIFQTSPLYI